MYKFITCLMLLSFPALAQQAQPEPKYLLGPLQAQRDQAANQAAICGAENAKLQEELAALKAKLVEAEAKAPK